MHRIVILSDNLFLSRAVAFSLGGLGAEVCTARNYEEWMTCCRRGAVDLVILLRAADFLGRRQVVERLRRAGGNPQLFVLMWHHSERVALALLEQGVNQCMTFPVDLARLRRKVAEELIERYE